MNAYIQVSKAQFDRVWGYIESGMAEGAKVVLGGQKRSTSGFWVDPTSKGPFNYIGTIVGFLMTNSQFSPTLSLI